MKEWFEDFWAENGKKLIFMFLTTVFGVCFVKLCPDMAGEGKTLLLGVGAFCMTQMRGGNTNGKK